MFSELDLDIDEQIEYFERLTKSADVTTRERAEAQLDRIASVDLEKVGPKGYIHGWIFVGAPGVGGRVFHPHHGHGVVTRHGKRTVGVRFDSGKEHAFEHSARGARVSDQTVGHFGHRLDGRTGKPVAAHKPIEAGTGRAKPGLPRAEHAKRGDIVMVAHTIHGDRGDSLTTHHVGRVTGVTRDGKVTRWTDAHRHVSRGDKELGSNESVTHVVPKDRIDVEGALAAEREGGSIGGYTSRQEAAATLHPHVKPEGHVEPPKPKKPAAPKAPKERAPGEARRGDIVLVHDQSIEGTHDGRGRTAHRLRVARVTSVSRDGKVKEYLHADAGEGARPYKVSNDRRSTQYHIIPQEKIDTEAALATYRERKWHPDGHMSKPYDSLGEAREAMRPHLRATESERRVADSRALSAPESAPNFEHPDLVANQKEPEAPKVPQAPEPKINYGDQTPATNIDRLKPHQLRPGMRLHTRLWDDPNHPDPYDESKPERYVTLGMVVNGRAPSWSRQQMSRSGGMYHLYDTHGNLISQMSPNHRIKVDTDVKPVPNAMPRITTIHNSGMEPGGRSEQTIVPSKHAVDNLGAPAPQMLGYGGSQLDPLDPHYGYPGMINYHREQQEIANRRPPGYPKPDHQSSIDALNAKVEQVKADRAKYGEPEQPKPKTPTAPKPKAPKPKAPEPKAMPDPASNGMQERFDHFTPEEQSRLRAEAHELRTTQGVTAAGAWRAVIEGAEQDRLTGIGRYSRRTGPVAPTKAPEPPVPTRTAREEIDAARNSADFVTQSHPAVKRAEQAVFRSTHGPNGRDSVPPSPAAIKGLHEAYRTAGIEQADKAVNKAWEDLTRRQRERAVTDPEFGDKVLKHLAEVHRHTRSRNDPTVSKETRASHAEAADAAMRDVHSIATSNADWRHQSTGRRMELENRARNGDPAAALELLPPRASDTHTRRLAEALTPQVDPAYTGKRLQAAKAVRDAEVEVRRTQMTRDALDNRARSNPVFDVQRGPVREAIRAEAGRDAEAWGEAMKANDQARERLSKAEGVLSQAKAEHNVAVGKEQSKVMDQMRAEFDALPAMPKSTEGKDIARAAGVPRTITRLTGQEKDLAREVNKRADILSEGRDKSNVFNRQADIVEATHGRLSGTLHQENQDRLNAIYDQARDQRGDGPNSVYRENLDDAIERWNLFQRAKNGVPPRDEQEVFHRETLASQVQSREPELAARIRAGNVPGGRSAEPQAIESEQAESTLPIPDLPKPRSRKEPKPYVEPAENTLEPGAKVTWTHQHEDGTTTQRTGRVWSKAPKPGNAQDAAWVTPDEKLPSDRYSALVVHQDRPTKKGRPVQFESSDSTDSHSGSLAESAARIAAQHRATGKSFRPIDPLIEAAIEHALSVAAA